MDNLENLKPGAKRFWAEALDVPRRFGHDRTGLNHFLLALLERHASMAESLASGIRTREYYTQIQRLLEKGDVGEPLDLESLLRETLERARLTGGTKVSERDLAAVLLSKAGWTIVEEGSQPLLEVPRVDAGDGKLPALALGSEPKETTPAYRPRAQRATPLLEKFGRDLCQEALDGKLPPILGRDIELQAMMETLCRWTKRNPLLIGPAGVGKTAIAEALAQRVVRGEIPAPLQGIRIFALQPSVLVSGASAVGQLEERMRAIVDEASQDGIVLFIDELHTIVGSGGMRQISDVGSLLKPALAKGNLACIGATTDAEYYTFIEQDRALERRFQPIRIQELSAEATLEILRSLREKARNERNVTCSDQALELILLLSKQYLRNRHYPDKAIDVFEQCVAFAMLNGVQEITPTVVHDVMERMVGIPVDLGAGLSQQLEEVKQHLLLEAFCPAWAADQLSERLEIAMRSLDVNPTRPNAVVGVVGAPGQSPELTAQVLAECLYGSRERLVEVDMARFVHPADVTWLTGAPPGYVGHDNIQQFQLNLAQQPWTVVLFSNVQASHPQAQEVLAQALQAGFFLDSRGRRVYLSDAVVVLTFSREGGERRIGFLTDTAESRHAPEQPLSDISSLVVPALLAQMDLYWQPERPTTERLQSWLERWVIPPLGKRYQRQGLEIEWDPSVLKWLSEAILSNGDLMQGERLVEERVLPLLIPFLKEPAKVMLYCDKDGTIKIRPKEGE